MDIQEQHERGLKLRTEHVRARGGREAIERVRRIRQAAAAHHQRLCVWRRLEPGGAAAGDEVSRHDRHDGGGRARQRVARAPEGRDEERLQGEEIQEVLLLLTLYCGIPAANEAHRIAAEVLREEKLM